MIAFLDGEIYSVELGDFLKVIVAVNGVGYLVFMPKNSANMLKVGERAHIFTSQVVREDSLTLYGFLEQGDQDIFERLLSVSGVGPKLALALVSALGADGVRSAVANDDIKTLSSAPGLGKKGAQKIILELKGKLVDTLESVQGSAHPLEDILEQALESLGYKPSIAKDAAVRTLEQNPDLGVDEASTGIALKKALALLAK
ncbi:MAG: Holliday junction branch migration protein RuvA [Candidatus Ancillula sp.]|jgi:Holliday junction DNA helicase RuvA|nr:Holliday junction branch migration protein RuvA [Candidatus Ancillula sp.]